MAQFHQGQLIKKVRGKANTGMLASFIEYCKPLPADCRVRVLEPVRGYTLFGEVGILPSGIECHDFAKNFEPFLDQKDAEEENEQEKEPSEECHS